VSDNTAPARRFDLQRASPEVAPPCFRAVTSHPGSTAVLPQRQARPSGPLGSPIRPIPADDSSHHSFPAASGGRVLPRRLQATKATRSAAWSGSRKRFSRMRCCDADANARTASSGIACLPEIAGLDEPGLTESTLGCALVEGGADDQQPSANRQLGREAVGDQRG
jgi:hypothetical protein